MSRSVYLEALKVYFYWYPYNPLH